MNEAQLATRQPREISQAPTLDDMMLALSQNSAGGNDTVGMMERLCVLRENLEKREAEKAFNRAFVKMQRELPEIRANKVIPNRDGTSRSTFASYDEIWDKVKPFLANNGFAVSYTTESTGDTRVKVTCRLMHEDGHHTETPFEARGGGGAPGTSNAQQDGGTANFAKRYALCLALNIVIDHDDARSLGPAVSAEQAVAIYDRATACGADHNALLQFAQVERFEDIPASKYGEIDEMLAKKERAKAKRAPVKPEERDADGNFTF